MMIFVCLEDAQQSLEHSGNRTLLYCILDLPNFKSYLSFVLKIYRIVDEQFGNSSNHMDRNYTATDCEYLAVIWTL